MAITLNAPRHSFVQFSVSDSIQSCEFPDIQLCLPVYDEDDVTFQFIVSTDTELEANDLCDLTNAKIRVGIVADCDEDFLIEFTGKPERFRIGTTQILYNWGHGLPGFATVISRGECFKIKIAVGAGDESSDFNDDFSDDFGGQMLYNFCSTCFQRIAEPCHTSVVEYSNEDNFADFNYCNSSSEGEVGSEGGSCESTIIQFFNVPTLSIPYTAALLAKHGPAPSVKLWIYDQDSVLVDMGIRITFDTYPPSVIKADMGGNGSGIMVIK